jgi:hypothetical protein
LVKTMAWSPRLEGEVTTAFLTKLYPSREDSAPSPQRGEGRGEGVPGGAVDPKSWSQRR